MFYERRWSYGPLQNREHMALIWSCSLFDLSYWHWQLALICQIKATLLLTEQFWPLSEGLYLPCMVQVVPSEFLPESPPTQTHTWTWTCTSTLTHEGTVQIVHFPATPIASCDIFNPANFLLLYKLIMSIIFMSHDHIMAGSWGEVIHE